MHLGWLGSWYSLQKMAERQIKSGMVTGCKIKRLKMIYRGKSVKTGKKGDSRSEVHNVWMEKANFSTQAAVLWHYVYELWSGYWWCEKAVRCKMELVSYPFYKVQTTFQQGVNSEKHPQTKCMIWQKSCMALRM